MTSPVALFFERILHLPFAYCVLVGTVQSVLWVCFPFINSDKWMINPKVHL